MASHPPVLIVHGEHAFLRRRFVRNLLEEQAKDGWRIEILDAAKSKFAVGDALDGAEMFGGRVLLVVENPEKGDLDLYLKHNTLKSPDIVLLLHMDSDPKGNTRFGKFVETNKKQAKGFPLPSQWDMAEAASKFAVAESIRLGRPMEPRLATELVSRVGSDLGILSFELQKMALLAQAEGVPAIGPQQVKGAMAELAEADLGPIVDALASRNRKSLAQTLSRVYRTSKDDPTIRVCRFLAPTVTKWLQAASLLDRKPEDAATELGMNLWFYKNKVLPPAYKWGRSGVIRLVHALAESERGVLDGQLEPWTAMMVKLLMLCAPVASQ